ncbi:MAG: MFS transporter, partial [Actinobacteria bacterium]|nr:MFS transporter [Actinomycetota bacterium]
IFYINVPFALASLVVTSIVLHIPKIKREHSIDYLGALLLVGSVVPILLTLSVYGPENGWADARTIIFLIIGLIVAVLFILQEKRAKEPILPLHLFNNHTFNVTSILGAVIGAGMFGAIVMIPLYLQVVKGYSASDAGIKLIPLMLGILTMSIYSGKSISKHGHYKRGTALFGSILTNRLAHYMQSGFAELAKSNPDAIANFDQSKLEALTNNSALIKTLPTEVQNTVLQAFVNSFHVVFVSAAPVTAMGIFLALMLKEVRLRTNEDYKKAREEVAGEQLG